MRPWGKARSVTDWSCFSSQVDMLRTSFIEALSLDPTEIDVSFRGIQAVDLAQPADEANDTTVRNT